VLVPALKAPDSMTSQTSRNQVIPEVRHEFDIKYEDRFWKIREAAAAVIRELSSLRSAGPVTADVLDAEVIRVAKKKLQLHGCDLVVSRIDDGATRFLIKVQSTGRTYDLIKSFFHCDRGSVPEPKCDC
jgi:hypothetical protein